MDSIARKWRDLSGQSKWKRLLDPLDTDLQRYILHYGELAQSTYDAFNIDRKCKYAGNCLFNKGDFFSKVFMKKGNINLAFKYSVTKFLYATSKASAAEAFFLRSISKDAWSLESNWMGYVAVASDECKEAIGRRDIVVAWRGTVQGSEWVQNFNFQKERAPLIFGDSHVEIHHGFYSVYTSDDPKLPDESSAQKQVLNEIRRLVELYKNEEVSITVTGHSLGGALAIINAVDIVANGFNISKEQPSKKACPVTVFAFASPRVGNSSFAKIFSEQNDLRALVINNVPDIVPKSLNIIDYSKVGEEFEIDTENYSLLWNDIRAHYLEVYLQGIAETKVRKRGRVSYRLILKIWFMFVCILYFLLYGF